MDATVAGVLVAMSNSIGSRHQAAEILQKVAEAGSWGGFPSDVTCDQVGEALERICLNAPIPNPLTRVLKGWRKAAHRRAHRLAQV
jgi:hypothetical protein